MRETGPAIRRFTKRDTLSPLTRHALGLAVLLLTIVPAYLVGRSTMSQAAREVHAAEELAIVRIVAHIREVAIHYGLSPLLVAAIIEAESEFNPRAVSRKGARGLMQLMPGTALSLEVEDTFDPFENVEGGVRHLRGLMDRFDGNLPLVLAAYNAGEQAVSTYRGVPPYPETRRYVTRILRRIGREDLAAGVGDAETASRAVVPVATRPTGSWRAWRIQEIRAASAILREDDEHEVHEHRRHTEVDLGSEAERSDAKAREAKTASRPHQPASQGP